MLMLLLAACCIICASTCISAVGWCILLQLAATQLSVHALVVCVFDSRFVLRSRAGGIWQFFECWFMPDTMKCLVALLLFTLLALAHVL
jgi:hypothetical protein